MINLQKLHLPQQFTYEYFLYNRYSISQKQNYQALCNNGFIKLYTMNCRLYWHTQNQFNHLTPDWKIHISVKIQQLALSWNLIAALFYSMKCRSGMKTYYLKQCYHMEKGRQITIYIFKYDKQYNNSKLDCDYSLSRSDQHSDMFWYQFISNIQKVLNSHQIQQNGLAQGDLKLGKYVSLRNQAYIIGKNGQYIYPPNQNGWNPNKMDLPFNLEKLYKFIIQNQQADHNNNNDKNNNNNYKQNSSLRNRSKLISFLILPVSLVSLSYFNMKYRK